MTMRCSANDIFPYMIPPHDDWRSMTATEMLRKQQRMTRAVYFKCEDQVS